MAPKTTCKTCGRSYVYDPHRGHTRERCNSCMANYGGRRAIFKQCVVEYLGGKCVECGYSKCLAALHPHHKDPSQKRFTIGAAKCRRWAYVRKELDKCELLCANCHAEAHYKDPVLLPRRRKQEPTIEWPSKRNLSKMVVTQPLVKIAKKLGVSDVAVKKRCRKLGILTRGRGAWSKEASGRGSIPPRPTQSLV